MPGGAVTATVGTRPVVPALALSARADCQRTRVGEHLPCMSTLALPPGPAPVTLAPWSLLPYLRGMRRDSVGMVGERFARYGRLYYAPFLGRPVYALADHRDAQQVLVTQATRVGKREQGFTARQLRMLLGNGLLNANGEQWRRQRRLVQPAFKRTHLEHYARTVVERTTGVAERWSPGQSIDVSAEMMSLTLAIVSEALFDHEVSSDSDRVVDVMRAFRGAFGGLQSLLPPWLPTRAQRRTQRALSDMDELVYGLIDARRGSEGDDLLSVLVNSTDVEGDGAALGRTQLRDELLTLFIAGHETTSHALSWTWYLLSHHRDVEERMHRELDRVLAGRQPTYADLERLVYTGQVLDEAMRLFPPAYALSRTANRPVELRNYTVPAGADMVIWIYHVHRDPSVYPDPGRFDPDRFDPEVVADRPAGAYLPFGAGSRTCVGKHFALMEAKLILALLASRYRVVVDPDYQVRRQLAVTLAPRGPLPARLEVRRVGEARTTPPVSADGPR